MIKRYDVIGDALIWEENDGEYVLYSDYEKLQAELDETNSNLKTEAKFKFSNECADALELNMNLQSKLDKAIACLKPFSGKDGYEQVNQLLAEMEK